MKNSRSSWLLIALFLLAPLAQADKEKAKEHFRKGMARYTLEKWDEAIAEFEEGYTEEPDPSFLYNIAQAHRLANHSKLALDFYKKFLNKRPDAPNRAEIEEHMAALQRGMVQGGEPIPPGKAKPGAPAVARPAPVVVAPRPEPVVVKPEPVAVKPEPKPAPVVVAPKPEPRPAPVVAPRPEPKPAPVAVVSAKPAPRPAPAAVEKPVPAGAQNLGQVEPPPAEKKRWPLWVGIAAGAVVVAGGAVTAGILLSQPGMVVLPAEMVP